MGTFSATAERLRKYGLKLHGRAINQACSKKDFHNLKRLIRRRNLLVMETEDWEILRVTEDTVLNCLRADERADTTFFLDMMERSSLQLETKGPGLQCLGRNAFAACISDRNEGKKLLSLSLPGISCACLILTVLLMRKITAIMKIRRESCTFGTEFWSGKSYHKLEWVFCCAMKEESSFNHWQLWERRSQPMHHLLDPRAACMIMAAALLQLDAVFQGEWVNPPQPFTSMLMSAFIVKATLAGDEAALRSILSSQPQNYIAQHACAYFPYLLNLAVGLGSENLEGCVSVFRDFHARCNLSVEDFLQSVVRVTCAYNESSSDLRPHSHHTIARLIRHAPFFFDAKVVSKETLLSMDSYPWDALKNFTALRMVHFFEGPLYPVYILIKNAFEDLCMRGGAGMFLIGLQDETLLDLLPKKRYYKKVLELIKLMTKTVQPSLEGNSCALCRNPTISFLVWAMRNEHRLNNNFDLKRVAVECIHIRLPSMWKLKQLSYSQLCDFHKNAAPNPFSIADECERWKEKLRLR